MRDRPSPDAIDPDVDLQVAEQRRETRPRRWDITVVIAAGGALGALARHGLSQVLPDTPDGFPWSTFAANVAGCFLIGMLMVVLVEVISHPHRLARPFLGVGVLGGFTTFSTYTVETQQLVGAGALRVAFSYQLATLAAALLAVQIGIIATRAMHRARRRKGATR